jgi:hypothetical protein
MADYEKHVPHTDALDTLGSKITDKEKRDAIHLAVYPTVAGQSLVPGMHVKLENGVAVATDLGEGFGIVDPFLTEYISPGEMFWLVIYPRQIHSLRHVWEHPSFPPSGEIAVETKPKITFEEAEEWLKNFVSSHDLPSFEKVIDAATGKPPTYNNDYNMPEWIIDDDYLTFIGNDAHCNIPPEFWDYVSVYSGIDKKDLPCQLVYFSCSC